MREIKKFRYFFAAILTLFIFTTGILASNFIDDTRQGALEQNIQQNNVDLESKQLQLNYIQSDRIDSCSAMETGLRNIVTSYNERLDNVQTYRQNSLFKQETFDTVERSYVLSGIRYYLFAQELREECDYEANTILFFTDSLNGEQNCEDCGALGSELSLLKNRYGEELLIFSIPLELDDGMVDLISAQYNVTNVPTLVINGDEKLEGYHTHAEIRENLDLNDDEDDGQ